MNNREEHGESGGGADRAEANELMREVYTQLRAQAQQWLNEDGGDAWGGGRTLSATAMVHEAMVKLGTGRKVPWANRAHYYAAAAQAMRWLLIDHARAKMARQRAIKGAHAERVRKLDGGLVDAESLSGLSGESILAVEEALVRLEKQEPEAGEVIRLRFYAGLSVEQTAECMGVSQRTVARLWTYARARMMDELSGGGARAE
jgi:RNA polymerase sigma-70 factor (ECF subfamily)